MTQILTVCFSKKSESKSFQDTRTIRSIFADLNIAVVWIVSLLLFISNSPSLFSKPLGTVPSWPTKIGNTVILMLHRFFGTLATSKNFFIVSFYFLFNLLFAVTVKFTRWHLLFHCKLSQYLVFWPVFYGYHLWTDYVLYIYHLLVLSNFDLLHNSLLITFPMLSLVFLLCQCMFSAQYLQWNFHWANTSELLLVEWKVSLSYFSSLYKHKLEFPIYETSKVT